MTAILVCHFSGQRGRRAKHRDDAGIDVAPGTGLVAEGKFHVHAVATADEALELVIGRIADVRDHDGHFPVGSVNAPVEARLLRFADDVRRSPPVPNVPRLPPGFATGRRSWALAQFLPWPSGFHA